MPQRILPRPVKMYNRTDGLEEMVTGRAKSSRGASARGERRSRTSLDTGTGWDMAKETATEDGPVPWCG